MTKVVGAQTKKEDMEKDDKGKSREIHADQEVKVSRLATVVRLCEKIKKVKRKVLAKLMQ